MFYLSVDFEQPPPPTLFFLNLLYLLSADSGFDADLLEQVKELELQGVSAAEAGDLPTALQRFSQAIKILPQRASAYNNRAQALRLQGDTAGRRSSHSVTSPLSADLY